jgi:DNA-binding IclR family transcriptional regulator
MGRYFERPTVPTSLSKALQLLSTLADETRPMSIRQIAASSELPRTTVHRLVSEMREAGLVESIPEGHRLGLRLFELGGTALRQHHVEALARPYMEELFERTHYTVQLAVLQDTDILYLARVGHQGHRRVASHVGGRVPATCTAAGKALLAFDAAALHQALSFGLVTRTRHSVTDPKILRQSLVETRRTHVAYDVEEARVGLVCAASPLFIDGRARFALSASTDVETFDPRMIGTAVRRTALRLSKVLSSN